MYLTKKNICDRLGRHYFSFGPRVQIRAITCFMTSNDNGERISGPNGNSENAVGKLRTRHPSALRRSFMLWWYTVEIYKIGFARRVQFFEVLLVRQNCESYIYDYFHFISISTEINHSDWLKMGQNSWLADTFNNKTRSSRPLNKWSFSERVQRIKCHSRYVSYQYCMRQLTKCDSSQKVVGIFDKDPRITRTCISILCFSSLTLAPLSLCHASRITFAKFPAQLTYSLLPLLLNWKL